MLLKYSILINGFSRKFTTKYCNFTTNINCKVLKCNRIIVLSSIQFAWKGPKVKKKKIKN